SAARMGSASVGRVSTPSAGAGRGEGELAVAPALPEVIPPSVAAPVVPPAPLSPEAGPLATATAPPPWALVRPLALGAEVAHGWRVSGLTGVVDGVCVLTLENARGRVHRVHLCRNDGRPQGLVFTDRFDLVVMNGGQGDLPTEEGLAQAVAKVAPVLAGNESA